MFDVSQRQSCRVRVAITNSPLHALTTLNDPTFVEAARVLGERAMGLQSERAAQIAQAFALVVGRAPDARERALLLRMFAGQRAQFAAHPEGARALLAVGESKSDVAPTSGVDEIDHAAFAATCLGILNLDEALTRE